VLSEGRVIFWEDGKWGGARPVTIFDSPVRSTEPSTVERFPLALFAFPIFPQRTRPTVTAKQFSGLERGKSMGMFSVFYAIETDESQNLPIKTEK